jgi:predicted nucleic acid-binding protein
MIDPEAGPFLFDTSAESWLARQADQNAIAWLRHYSRVHPVTVSAVTVTERVRGYSMLWRRTAPQARERIEAARVAYLSQLTHGNVLPIDSAVAVVAGEVMALVPDPPTPPRRSHLLVESGQDRLARWRFDGTIAATALVAGMPLLHNNAADFEAVRSAIERAPERFPGLGPLELIRCSLLFDFQT